MTVAFYLLSDSLSYNRILDAIYNVAHIVVGDIGAGRHTHAHLEHPL